MINYVLNFFSGLFWHKLPPILNHNCPFLGEITGTRLPWPPARWRAKISSERNLEVFWLSSKKGIPFPPFCCDKKTSLVLWFQPYLENMCQIGSSFTKKTVVNHHLELFFAWWNNNQTNSTLFYNSLDLGLLDSQMGDFPKFFEVQGIQPWKWNMWR